jgi:asparagine synthase (glutamine-hydrolysing)
MSSEDGLLTVVFNGEIYNYVQLRAELDADGVLFRTKSDTEVLLHVYARYGPEMVHKLRGMFAFAIWDEARSGLFLARDTYGIKPLYTANDGWTFRFASQVKALRAGGHVSDDPEPAGVVGFQLFGSVPEPFTLYREIRSLPAGHSQWVDAAGPREPSPFATLARIFALAQSVRRFDANELSDTVRGSVCESVRTHLLADVEVGIFLSAGVDSAALLALMRDVSPRDIRAITLAFEEFRGTPQDEAPLAARVAARYGVQHIVRTVSEREFRHELPVILAAMDQPTIDGVNLWFVSKAAKEVGLKVALSGLGGDELFAGYPSFRDLPSWRRRFGPVAAIPGIGIAARTLIRSFAPGIARARPKALGFLEHASSWAGLYLLRRGLFLPHELSELMAPDVTREGLRRLKPMRYIEKSLIPDPGRPVARVCILESAHYLRNQLLRDADWAGMTHSIEIRTPLVDVALLKALAPAIGTLVPGAGKTALARAPSLPLPDEVVTRAKTGFEVPTAAWIAKAVGPTRVTCVGQSKGTISRLWSRKVLAAFAAPNTAFVP